MGMARSDFVFCWRFRARYAECDPQGVVFNARYLDYADVILTEFWRSRGIRITGEAAFETHVVRATIDYRQPIRVDEEVEGLARTARIGRSSLTSHVELHGVGVDACRAAIEIISVHVDLATARPLHVPDDVRDALQGGRTGSARAAEGRVPDGHSGWPPSG